MTVRRYVVQAKDLSCGIKYLVEIVQPRINLTFSSYIRQIDPPNDATMPWVLYFENDVTLRLYSDETIVVVEGL